jgi:hypothetical protein
MTLIKNLKRTDMKKFKVKWNENRVINVFAEVYANSKEEAIEKAQRYEINEDKGEYLEEMESHTDMILTGKATEIKE